MGLKSQKKQLTALSWHFFFVFIYIYLYFFGWRVERKPMHELEWLAWEVRGWAPFVDQFGIRKSRYVPFTHTLKLKS